MAEDDWDNFSSSQPTQSSEQWNNDGSFDENFGSFETGKENNVEESPIDEKIIETDKEIPADEETHDFEEGEGLDTIELKPKKKEDWENSDSEEEEEDWEVERNTNETEDKLEEPETELKSNGIQSLDTKDPSSESDFVSVEETNTTKDDFNNFEEFGSFEDPKTTENEDWGNFDDFQSSSASQFDVNFEEPQAPEPNVVQSTQVTVQPAQVTVQPTQVIVKKDFFDLPSEERKESVFQTFNNIFGSFEAANGKEPIGQILEDLIKTRDVFLSLGVRKELRWPPIPFIKEKFCSSLGISILPEIIEEPDT